MVISDALPRSPWRTIWFRPQATIIALVERGGTLAVPILAAVGGVVSLLSFVPESAVLRDVLVAIALLFGPLAGVLSLYIAGALVTWTGRLLGGVAPQSAVRIALAWSSVPDVVALPIWLGFIFMSAKQLSPGAPDDGAIVAVGGMLILLIVLSVWRLFLFVRTIGAVLGFGFWRSVASGFLPVVLLLGVAVGVRTFAFQPFSTPSSSMEPTLIVGDNFFVNKFSYGWSRYSFPFDAGFEGRIFGALPERGDLVVFKLPRDNSTDYVKRIVGLPGDEILLQRGVLHINGVAVQKTVSDQAGIEFSRVVPGAIVYIETLPEGRHYAVVEMEENGPFDNVGPYKVPEGHYFVLGDNRDNSTDSRASWGVGFVPYDNLVGRVELIYFSADLSSGGADLRWKRMFSIPR